MSRILRVNMTDLTTKFEDVPEKYKLLNPSNGWGSYEGALEFLQNVLVACTTHPLAKVYVSK